MAIVIISLIITFLFNFLHVLDNFLWYKLNEKVENPIKDAFIDAYAGVWYSFIPVVNILLLAASVRWLSITIKSMIENKKRKG